MTDRHSGYVVALEHDLREDDAEIIIAAISQLRGVASVTPVRSEFPEQQIAEQRVALRIRERLFEVVAEELK